MVDRSRLLEVHGSDKRFLVFQVQSQPYVEGRGQKSPEKMRQSGMIVVFYQDGERSSSASKKEVYPRRAAVPQRFWTTASETVQYPSERNIMIGVLIFEMH